MKKNTFKSFLRQNLSEAPLKYKEEDGVAKISWQPDPARGMPSDDDPHFKSFTTSKQRFPHMDEIKVLKTTVNCCSQEEMDDLLSHNMTHYQETMPVYYAMPIKGETGKKQEQYFHALKNRKPEEVVFTNMDDFVDMAGARLASYLFNKSDIKQASSANKVLLIPMDSSSSLPLQLANSIASHLTTKQHDQYKSNVAKWEDKRARGRPGSGKQTTYTKPKPVLDVWVPSIIKILKKSLPKTGTMKRSGAGQNYKMSDRRPLTSETKEMYELWLKRWRSRDISGEDYQDFVYGRLESIEKYMESPHEEESNLAKAELEFIYNDLPKKEDSIRNFLKNKDVEETQSNSLQIKKVRGYAKRLCYDMVRIDKEQLESHDKDERGNIKPLPSGTYVVLVDDNIVSGRTFEDAYRVLYKSGLINGPGIHVIGAVMHNVY